MSNLGKLTLYVRITCEDLFIDPMALINDFSMDLSQLVPFDFILVFFVTKIT